MIRTKGEAGTGNVVEAVRQARAVFRELDRLTKMNSKQLASAAREMRVPLELVKRVAKSGKLPVVNFSAGGIATPADAALMMQLGVEGIFVGSGIFKSANPKKRAQAIVEATTHFDNPDIIAKVSEGLGEPMRGIELSTLSDKERLSRRGI